MDPELKDLIEKLKAAIAELEAARNAFEELQAVLTQNHVRNNLAFNGLQSISGHVKQLVCLSSSIG